MAEAIYLIIALLSYFSSRKAGLSKGKSALIAAGVTGAAVHFDVGGKVENWWSGINTPTVDGDPVTVPNGTPVTGIFDKVGSWVGENGSLIGQVGMVGAGAAVGSGVLTSIKNNWVPWAVGGVGLFLLLRN